jgi:hypothetical protein
MDFLSIAEFSRKRNNRMVAARLHLVLSQSYEIIEIFRILLDELKKAMDSHMRVNENHRFSINPHRIASLLHRQASNLEIMEILTTELLDEIRILDHRFEQIYRHISPGKFGIMFRAQGFLMSARFPLVEDSMKVPPPNADGTYLALQFTWEISTEDPPEAEEHYYVGFGPAKRVVDVRIDEADEFFRALKWYLENCKPYERIRELEEITECYKQALIKNFTLEEILTDISKVKRHYNWAE